MRVIWARNRLHAGSCRRIVAPERDAAKYLPLRRTVRHCLVMSAQPKHPVVPLEVWRPAFDAILAFRALAPWEWMFDCDTCVLVDAAGVPWFATVLGMAREVRGLALYRGAQGLRTLQASMDPMADPTELGFRMDALTIWFGAKNELPAAQRELYGTLGHKPVRGMKWAWPAVLDHTPGYAAWGPTAEQVAWLAKALPAVMRFAALVQADPRVVANRSRGEYPTVPLGGAATLHAEDLEWRHWRADPEPVSGDPVRLEDESLAAGLRALPVAAGRALDLAWFFMADTIAEGDRPYHGRILVALDPETAVCLGMEVVSIHDDLAKKAAHVLAEQFRRGGVVPATIRVQDPELERRLGPLLNGIGSHVEMAGPLESVAAFREAMAAFMGR